MALERWIDEQEKQGNLQAVTFGRTLLEKFGDVPFFEKTDYVGRLKNAVKEYKRDPVSPEAATMFWQAFWDKNGNKLDFKTEIPRCILTRDQIQTARRSGIELIYVPEDVSNQEKRYMLGKMFTRMHGHSVRPEDNEVRNTERHSGWRFFDSQIEPLITGTIEADAIISMRGRHAEAPTLNEYIIASQASKLLTGKYLDEDHFYSRLLGSILSGETIVARFAKNGELDVVPYSATKYAPRIGARFSFPAK